VKIGAVTVKWTVLVLLGALVLTLSLSPVRAEDEQTMRAKFADSYNRKRWKERLEALEHLKSAKEDRTFQILYHVSVFDTDPEVRAKAFRVLASCHDQWGYVAYLCAQSLTAERVINVKYNKAAAMGGLRYKYHAAEALADFLRRLRYRNHDWYYIDTSDLSLTAEGRARDSVKSWEGYTEPDYFNNERAGMKIVVGAINSLGKAKLQVRPRLDQEVVEWWNRHKEYILEDDQKLRAKEVEQMGEKKPEPDKVNPEKVKMEKVELQQGEDPLDRALMKPEERKEPAPMAKTPEKRESKVQDEE